jgi:glycosyltransferase involved in cell wall biosynthesis
MVPIRRVAFVGNHLPRRCGIATFTHDLQAAVAMARPGLETSVVAITDLRGAYDYPSSVRFQIREENIDDYVRAAEFLNDSRMDVVNLQHEYGIFGGEAGGHVAQLLSRLAMPIVTTLHTVLAEPTAAQRNAMRHIIDVSSKVVVMSETGRKVLLSAHREAAGKIEVVPHGIPDRPFVETHAAKAKFGLKGKTVILTFGLLSPNKGIETVIDAMPEILRSCPSAIYMVLGVTHPNLLRDRGEAYRESLMSRARQLGVDDHVVFLNQFVEQATLLDYISACDVYVTPYLNEAQMTSGTLAYSFGLGKAVVSTPYWHAKELLSDGRGILVPFDDSKAIGAEIAGLLTDEVRHDAMRNGAYAASRSMTWVRTAESYLAVFESAHGRWEVAAASTRVGSMVAARQNLVLPEIRIGHFLSLCDSTGMLQHAVYSVPDRSHGYCLDDNARALLLATVLLKNGETLLSETLTARFASFIQHAWNPDSGRFRNFMSYDRRWLEPSGSEDSHGRTIWALGEYAAARADRARCRWAAHLFQTALPAVQGFTSPRAWAFTLLGLGPYCAQFRDDAFARHLRIELADRMLSLLSAVETPEWRWFEGGLAYDNPRLSQAMIETGLRTGTSAYVEAGLRTLRWLMAAQTTPSGCFRPVGSESFGSLRKAPSAFDQQPVEAWATISACLAAARADGSAGWQAAARRAFAWFLGENDLKTPLVDAATGGCSDGLHPNRANENQGAESVLSYLHGLVEMRRFERAALKSRARSAPKSIRAAASQPVAAGTIPRGNFVPTSFSQPSGLASASRPGAGGRPTVQAGD